MAACGSLEHIFENPLPPDNSTLLESLSPWKRIESMKAAIADSSFNEIFGELHFKETHDHVHALPHESSSSTPSSPSSSFSSNSAFSNDINPPHFDKIEKNDHSFSSSKSSSYYPFRHKKEYRHSDSFSSMNSESLSLCTEGLGFESSDDVEDLMRNDVCNNNQQEERKSSTRNISTENHESKRSSTNRGGFPPPISCIGRSGKPWVCFKSYREDGRFILKEIMIPTQELLHACREDGRLKLRFILPDDEILEENEEEQGDKSNAEENVEDIRNNNAEKRESDRNSEEWKNGKGRVETSN